MGPGVVQLLEADSISVQSFHCPLSPTTLSSANVGVAVRIGNDTVTILNDTVLLNGRHVNESFAVEELALDMDMDSWTWISLTVGGLKLVSRRAELIQGPSGDLVPMPTGYFQNLHIELYEELLDRNADNRSLCTTPGTVRQPSVTNIPHNESLFGGRLLGRLDALCGSQLPGPSACCTTNTSNSTETCGM